MRFGILGPLQVMDGDRWVAVRGSSRRALLGALLVSANSPVSSDHLISDLWGEAPPKDPSGALFQAVSRLRRDVQTHLETLPGAYLLRVATEELDALRFEAIVEEGKSALADGDASRAAASFAEALGMWRGSLLADLPDLACADGERARFEALRRVALEGRVEAGLASGRHSEVLPELERLVAQEPFSERVWELLMLALYRAGRQQEALTTYKRVRSLLAGELGVEPGLGLREMEERILLQDPALQLEDDREFRPTGNLTSSPTALVGRRGELVEVSDLVGGNRLVTLTGPGGTGKTRLAIEVGLRLRNTAPDGAWMVKFDPVSDASELPRVLAGVLGLSEVIRQSPVDDLARYLQDRRALLILDNCEHLIQAIGALASGLLDHCAGLRMLATSRTPLGVPGEVVCRLGPLAVPKLDTPDPANELLSSEAGHLLVSRALAATNDLKLSKEWVGAAIELCRRLDGLPLAIELAAARLGAIDINDLLDGIGERLTEGTLMTSRQAGRHRSLEAALGWSHGLLSEGEAALFRRLSMFRGPFGMEAAEAVGGGDLPTADTLANLVDRSLLELEQGPGRYRMLQTVRAFGASRLEESGERAETADRHANFMLSLAETAVPLLHGPDQVTWIDLLEASHDDVRSAHARLVAAGDPRAIVLVAGLWWFWFRHGHVREGRQLLEAALEAVPQGFDAPRALALEGLAHMAWFQGAYDEANRSGAAALQLAERLGEETIITLGLAVPAVVARDADGDLVGARKLFEERVIRARRIGDRWMLAASLSLLATVASAQGDRVELGELVEQARAIYAEKGDSWGLSWSLLQDGQRALMERSYEEASDLCRESYRLAIPINHRPGMPLILSALALADSRRGHVQRAAGLLGVINQMETVLGVVVPVPERYLRQEATSLVAERLGDDRARQLAAHGASLRYNDANTFILDDTVDL